VRGFGGVLITESVDAMFLLSREAFEGGRCKC
jgi:hypothetical protein